MPASIAWYNPEETILQVTFEGRWTVEDFIRMVAEAQQLMKDKPPESVSIILNVEKSAGIPRGASVIPHFRNALVTLNYQYFVIGGGTSFGIALARVVSKVLPHKNRTMFFEENVAAAEQRITTLRAAVPK